MLSIPLPYINFRFKRRIIITILGIAVSVMFVISSFIVVNSLYASTSVLLDKFKKGNAILYEGDSISESRINVSVLNLKEVYAAGILVDVRINNTVPTYLVGIYSPWWKLGSKWINSCNISDDEIKAGRYLSLPRRSGTVSVTSSAASVEKNITGNFTSQLFPDAWVIGSINTARELAPWLGNGMFSFVIVYNMTESVLQTAQDNHLNVNEMPSALSFYAEGTNQLERDLWMVVAIAAVIITILLYTTMSMELIERKREIGVIRSIGANSKTIFFIFLSQTLLIAGIGAILGCISGVLASYAVTSFGIHIGYKTMFVVAVPPLLVALALVMAFTASIIGGIFPIYRSTRMKVTECFE